MNLTDRNWKPFDIGIVFNDIQRGKRLKCEDHKPGQKAYVSSSSENNAVDAFIGNEIGTREFEDCLTLANSGSVGFVSYHPYRFIASDHVTKLKKQGLSKYSYLFLAVAVARLSEKYSFNREINDKRLKREKIMLPVTSNGEPDYAFMEAYMKEQEQKLLKKYIDYQKNNGGGQVLSKPYGWMGYYVSEKANGLFHIASTKSGIDRNKLVVTGKEQFPYITRTDSNNGWDGFVTIQPNVSFDVFNVVTLGLDTQTAFYQPTPFYTGQNIQVLSGSRINKHVALFIIQMLKLQMRSKFNWGGNGATLGRLHKMKIMLPAKSDGTPDYKYMENYMKNIEAKQTQAYLAFKQQNA